VVARPICGSPQADHAVAEVAPAGDAQSLIVEEGALAALGDVEVVIGRL